MRFIWRPSFSCSMYSTRAPQALSAFCGPCILHTHVCDVVGLVPTLLFWHHWRGGQNLDRALQYSIVLPVPCWVEGDELQIRMCSDLATSCHIHMQVYCLPITTLS